MKNIFKALIEAQFSKVAVVYAMLLVTATIAGNFVLAWYGKPLLSDIAIAVIGTYGTFTTCGYFALSGARDCSKNKHCDGIQIDY